MAQHNDRFWMVYGHGTRQPVVRHKTEASALAEAERLAKAFPGVRFYVLEPVSMSVKIEVETTNLRLVGDLVARAAEYAEMIGCVHASPARPRHADGIPGDLSDSDIPF
ncbi:hypothetical protein [Ancylobacter sp.]|uniref:hypothetical protein n=1 Tax=Ancylobacter sp. TaxID=1872567 RepID=UPI003D103C23